MMGAIKKIVLIVIVVILGYGIVNVMEVYENSPFKPQKNSQESIDNLKSIFTQEEYKQHLELKEQYPDGIHLQKTIKEPEQTDNSLLGCGQEIDDAYFALQEAERNDESNVSELSSKFNRLMYEKNCPYRNLPTYQDTP